MPEERRRLIYIQKPKNNKQTKEEGSIVIPSSSPRSTQTLVFALRVQKSQEPLSGRLGGGEVLGF
jgi:hypothetical protein